MHSGQLCSKQQANFTHASKTPAKYPTHSYCLVIIILCASLYFVFQTKLIDVYGSVRVTYFEYVWNETFVNHELETPENEFTKNLLSDKSVKFLKFKNPDEISTRELQEATEIQTKSVEERQSSEDNTVKNKSIDNRNHSSHLTLTAIVDDKVNNYQSPEESQIYYGRSLQDIPAKIENEISTEYKSIEIGNEKSTEYKSIEIGNEKSTEYKSIEIGNEKSTEYNFIGIENLTQTEIDRNWIKHVLSERKVARYRQKNPTISRTTTKSPIILRMSGDIACKLPILQPFDPAIKGAWEAEDAPYPAECQVNYPPVFKSTFNFTLIKLRNTSEWKKCCYKSITRGTGTSSDVDNEVIESEDCTPMPNRITKLPNDKEFIVIYCAIPDRQKKALLITTNETIVPIDAFAFVPVKHKEAIISTNTTTKNSEDKVNVVIFGLDSVSHMNLMRIMPRVYKFLTQNLSAIGMSGFVKVGDNTYPNLLAALTAKTVAEAYESCEKDDFFDDCPFIWKEYAAQGYKTSYSEDAPPISGFNYLKSGFMKPPVDYYNRPLTVFSDNNLGSDLRGNAKICYGPKLAIEILVDYVKKVAFAMNSIDQRYFQFTWCTSLTHDSMKLGEFGENTLLEALEWLNSQNYLNNTILVFMSDHGIRYGNFRDTRQGKIEENMPFLYFTFPQWFRQKYPRAIKNMIGNNYRLTTPFDLYETLLEFVDLDKLEDSEIQLREEILKSKEFESKLPRGISMFLPSPLNRTCAMASIPEHFCSCHEVEELKIDNHLAKQAANFAIYTMNSFISLYPQCSYLTLANITRAYQFFKESGVHKNEIKIEEGVQVIFEVSPGAGEFDATVIRLNGTGNWTLSDMSRVNLYGTQSYCVDDAKMKKYCYCTALLPISDVKEEFDFDV